MSISQLYDVEKELTKKRKEKEQKEYEEQVQKEINDFKLTNATLIAWTREIAYGAALKWYKLTKEDFDFYPVHPKEISGAIFRVKDRTKVFFSIPPTHERFEEILQEAIKQVRLSMVVMRQEILLTMIDKRTNKEFTTRAMFVDEIPNKLRDLKDQVDEWIER
jgi:hypothetical protein